VIGSLFQLARPFLHALDPEMAHHATLAALQFAWLPPLARDDPRLAVSAFGLNFPNPIGLAAGFDKDGVAPDKLLQLGFGFVEVGTITPRPQPGNPRPRLFRLDRDRGVINRLGFNSAGHAKVRGNLAQRRGAGGIVGVNLGANKDSADRIADYVVGIEVFADVASYFTINVSSPNTPGLRDLQQAAALDELLSRALDARDRAAVRRPLLLKIAPDLSLAELDAIVRVARNRGIDGMIVSNTTIARPATLVSSHAKESGGLSGRPLFDPATQMLAETFRRAEGQFLLIGAGGIEGPETAFAKFEAGATLVQLYSSLVFDGPQLIAKIKRGIVHRLEQEKLRNLHDVIGRSATGIG
jgi:dihydroorotate dehydrogenase